MQIDTIYLPTIRAAERNLRVELPTRKKLKLRKLVDRQFSEIEGWILHLSKVNLLQYGISKKVLYRVKRSIRQANGDKLSKNTKLKFINCHHKLTRMVTSQENVAVPPLLPIINEVEVIAN
ncbi:MAG: hypothetical protein ACRD5H_15035 [Nitrososphaerales archaeon]